MAAPHSTPRAWLAGGPSDANAAREPRRRRARPARVRLGAGPAGSPPGADAARTSPARVRRGVRVRSCAWPAISPPQCWLVGYAMPYRKRPNSLDTYQSTYRNFILFIFLPILHGHVSIPYPVRIRIGYVSDTGYVANLTYLCNVA